MNNAPLDLGTPSSLGIPAVFRHWGIWCRQSATRAAQLRSQRCSRCNWCRKHCISRDAHA